MKQVSLPALETALLIQTSLAWINASLALLCESFFVILVWACGIATILKHKIARDTTGARYLGCASRARAYASHACIRFWKRH